MTLVDGSKISVQAGKTIKQKLNLSSEDCWVSGVVQYVMNDGKGLIFRDSETGKDVFILTHGREMVVK